MKTCKMSSLLTQPRTIVLHKPKKVFGSFLVNKDSNTPYSDATKVSKSETITRVHMRREIIS